MSPEIHNYTQFSTPLSIPNKRALRIHNMHIDTIYVILANTTLSRTYIGGSTTVSERTAGLAANAAAQSFGYVVGPGMCQLAY